jgi:hypothetical protein
MLSPDRFFLRQIAEIRSHEYSIPRDRQPVTAVGVN